MKQVLWSSAEHQHLLWSQLPRGSTSLDRSGCWIKQLRSQSFESLDTPELCRDKEQPGNRPTEHQHPTTMQHQHSANKREGAYEELAPWEYSPTDQIHGDCCVWMKTHLVVFAVAYWPCHLWCPEWTSDWLHQLQDLLKLCSLRALLLLCPMRERLLWTTWFPKLGQKEPTPRLAPPAPPSSLGRLSISSLGKSL